MEKKTILIVDDFQSIRRVLGNTLTLYGFHIMEAENGKVALELLSLNIDKVDLIVSDYNMPEMNGIELLSATKHNQNFKQIPFLLLTSESSKEIMKEAKEAGLDAWISKPYKIDAFINRIKYLLEKSGQDVSV